MERFERGQRVLVRRCGDGPVLFMGGARGTVVRMRRNDNGAWIEMDVRSEVRDAHPFPADDPGDRGRHVLAYPGDCDPEPAGHSAIAGLVEAAKQGDVGAAKELLDRGYGVPSTPPPLNRRR